MTTAHARADLLVTLGWLEANLGRPELRVLDVRWRPDGSGRAAWEAGHIPGAAYLDWAADLVGGTDDAGVLRLAPSDLVAAAFERAGIGDGTELVVYDDAASLFAARVWWSARAYGLRSVRILDGGFPAWVAAGRPVSSETALPAKGTFTASIEPADRVTWSEVRGLVRGGEVTFVDARPPVAYRNGGSGRGLEHLARAVVVPAAATTLPGTGAFRRAPELAALFARTKLEPGRRVVCYDSSGIGAAKLAFVVTLLGHDEVAVYDGGWAEWGERGEWTL